MSLTIDDLEPGDRVIIPEGVGKGEVEEAHEELPLAVEGFIATHGAKLRTYGRLVLLCEHCEEEHVLHVPAKRLVVE